MSTPHETLTLTLHGYGRLTWAEALPFLQAHYCTWTDLDGIHIAQPAPPQPPVGATHLWAWQDTTHAARLRFDTDHVYLATLRTTPPPTDRTPQLTETNTTITVRTGTLWNPTDRQAGPLPKAAHEWTWHLLEAAGPHPLAFVTATPATRSTTESPRTH
ncbi:hypothetical protein Q5762_30805 [Streptomyces sp. P9(2023)]|uniref:hypothetical protein n=1 Tax=Streptomyces sp. P9(2023) TaxID=3064394 RepID=UPI0028F43816|nr:hypothetical protein [Streptomyces sp. P9(2023)]MDT9692644.1 hypothetical protein [Streptomyces sp. P9(2023)]